MQCQLREEAHPCHYIPTCLWGHGVDWEQSTHPHYPQHQGQWWQQHQKQEQEEHPAEVAKLPSSAAEIYPRAPDQEEEPETSQ